MLPSKYLATARIYVDTETLLAPLLKGIAVDVDMNQQVEVMQRTLLSRPNLQKVLRSTDLGLIARTPEDEDRIVKQLGTDTAIHDPRIGTSKRRIADPSSTTTSTIKRMMRDAR